MKKIELFLLGCLFFLSFIGSSNALVTANGVEIINEDSSETLLWCSYSDDYWFLIDGINEPVEVDVPEGKGVYDYLPFSTLRFDELRTFGILSDNGWDCPSYISIDRANYAITGFSETVPSGDYLELDTDNSSCSGICNQVADNSNTYSCNYISGSQTLNVNGENNRCTISYPDGTVETIVNGICGSFIGGTCPDIFYDNTTKDMAWATFDYNEWFSGNTTNYDPEMYDFLCGEESDITYFCPNGNCEYPNNRDIRCSTINNIIHGNNNTISSNSDVAEICSSPSYRKPMLFLGTLLNFVKIIIPIVIIGFGIMDFYKAITSSKDDGLTKAFKSLMIRVIAGVAIFLLPGIVQLVLNMVNEWSDYSNNWCCCTECLLNGECDVNSCSSDSCKIEGMD